ncbi:DUF423 domain-containing protein [Roseococcus sp. DSY-14]|uniref:DUF423 domain-containing protein n=1 Tax=Roseococcus sp. DSY-14 TaxID=3369650 RepID=UPI00387B1CBA
MSRLAIAAAGLSGFLGVLLAAMSAHGDPERARMVGSVAALLGWHAPAFLGWLAWGRAPLAPALWAAGLLLFGGAVLARAFAGVSLGWTAPAGGILLMAGWLLVALAALRR